MATCEPHGFIECYLNVWLWRTIPVIQIVVGTIGNVLNIVVLSRRRMRKHSTTVYLIFLAGADTVALWSGHIPHYLEGAFGLDVRMQHVFWCRSLWWFSHSSAGFSVWLIVLMTIERMFLTTIPILARSKVSTRNSTIASTITLACSSFLSIHYLFDMDLKIKTTATLHGNQTILTNATKCTYDDGFHSFYRSAYPMIVLIVLNAIPVLIIVIGNTTILLALLLQKRRLRKTNPGGVTGVNGQNVTAYNKRKSSTKILFVVSGFFIVTTLPYSIYRLISSKYEYEDPRIAARRTLVTSLTIVLLYCNFAFNFVLYFLSGTMFKQELDALLKELTAKFRRVVLQQVDQPETRTTNVTAEGADKGPADASASQLR